MTIAQGTVYGHGLNVYPTRMAEAQIDFGSTPLRSAAFTLVDENITASSRVVVLDSGMLGDGLQQDEAEMDCIVCRAGAAAAGSCTIYAFGMLGPVAGVHRVVYMLIN